MTDLETAKSRVGELLNAALDGKVHENTEDYLNDITRDYEEFHTQEGDTGTVWRAKYEDLKRKYIDRFTGEIQIKTEEERQHNKDDDIEHKETETIMHVKDLFQ